MEDNVQELTKQALELFEQGKTRKQICKEMNVNTFTVDALLMFAGKRGVKASKLPNQKPQVTRVFHVNGFCFMVQRDDKAPLTIDEYDILKASLQKALS